MKQLEKQEGDNMDIKTTTIVFENGAQVRCPSMHQWDQGQVLLITGLDLPATVEFHFFNEATTEAVRVAGYTIEGITTTQVPNSLLQQPFNIYAYVYLTDAESARTEQKLRITVLPRPEPEPTSTDPNDPHYISGLSELLNQAATILKQQQDITKELSTFESVPIELYYSSTNVEQLTLLARKESENNG